jgi:DNA ligase-1
MASSAFSELAEVAERVGATTKRLEKLAAVAEWFARLDDDADLGRAARFLSAHPFPRHDMRTTQVGGSILHGALQAISGADPEVMHERYVRLGDTGSLAEELLAGRAARGLTLEEAESWLDTLARTSGTNARRTLVHDMLASLGAGEAKYLVRLLAGELRIGLKEAQVEEAAAKAFGRTITAVRHANLLRGDVGEVAVLARHDRLSSATLALFHPIGFMLAQPLPTAEEIVAAMPSPFIVEDKYDGIRAQAHVTGERVALYSRTLDEITRGYPEVEGALRALVVGAGAGVPPRHQDAPDPSTDHHQASAVASDSHAGTPPGAPVSLILDGELLAFDPAQPHRALPFREMQRRLGRKTVDAALRAEVPVAFVAYDCIAWDGALVVEESWQARRARLLSLPWPVVDAGCARAHARLAPAVHATTPEDVEAAFASARKAGNEGLIAKDPASPYTPGRRGKAWIKLKKATETLDVVITGAEWGHGKRRHVLSDYTFAVKAAEDDGTLLNVGKAYNGLTDAEIAELTPELEALTLQKFGRFQQVTPAIVLEVTFDYVQESKRHKAGYALRFPRIVRVRRDKPVAEIDTLARVRELAAQAQPIDGEGEGDRG